MRSLIKFIIIIISIIGYLKKFYIYDGTISIVNIYYMITVAFQLSTIFLLINSLELF